MSKLIILSGPAGSGKSTWANNYKKENSNTVIVSSDETRKSIYNTYDPKYCSDKVVKANMLSQAIEASKQSKDVILDSAVVKNKNILKWIRKLKDYFSEIGLVILDTPLETCLKQNLQRERVVPEEIIKEMYSFKEPLSEEVLNSVSWSKRV